MLETNNTGFPSSVSNVETWKDKSKVVKIKITVVDWHNKRKRMIIKRKEEETGKTYISQQKYFKCLTSHRSCSMMYWFSTTAY